MFSNSSYRLRPARGSEGNLVSLSLSFFFKAEFSKCKRIRGRLHQLGFLPSEDRRRSVKGIIFSACNLLLSDATIHHNLDSSGPVSHAPEAIRRQGRGRTHLLQANLFSKVRCLCPLGLFDGIHYILLSF